MTLLEDVYYGLNRRIPRDHVAAVLEQLDQHAVVVEHKKIPEVYFDEQDGVPVVGFIPRQGRQQRLVRFGHQHLSAKRALTAARDALAVLAALKPRNRVFERTYPLMLSQQYEEVRELYVRQLVEAKHIDDGGAPALAGGAL